MQTFYNNDKLHKLFAQFYEAGRASATICHGSAILLKTKLSNGKLLAEGKKWTGFCNAEKDIVDKGAGKKMQPFRIEDEAKKRNTNYVTGGVPYKSFAVSDGNLISGQQGSSGAETAQLVIKYLNLKNNEASYFHFHICFQIFIVVSTKLYYRKSNLQKSRSRYKRYFIYT